MVFEVGHGRVDDAKEIVRVLFVDLAPELLIFRVAALQLVCLRQTVEQARVAGSEFQGLVDEALGRLRLASA
jgi:hypothetical protein